MQPGRTAKLPILRYARSCAQGNAKLRRKQPKLCSPHPSACRRLGAEPHVAAERSHSGHLPHSTLIRRSTSYSIANAGIRSPANLSDPHSGEIFRTSSELNPLPQVACIILNWNGWRDTIECLDAIQATSYPRLTTIVVDNASTNDSVARIRTAHPQILLLQSETNRGFAGGNNIGIRYALERGADYIWLLNNDTKPFPDALSALVRKATSNLQIGAVGSVCYYADHPSRVQAWAGSYVNLWIGYSRLSTRPKPDRWFDSLNGASMLISSKAIEMIGLLDEGFFLYWEDTEFCVRLREHNWQLAAAPDSHVLHKVNASIKGNTQGLDRYFTASGLRILRLHSPAPRIASAAFLTMRLVHRLLRFQFSRARSVWAGLRDFRQTPLSPQTR